MTTLGISERERQLGDLEEAIIDYLSRNPGSAPADQVVEAVATVTRSSFDDVALALARLSGHVEEDDGPRLRLRTA